MRRFAFAAVILLGVVLVLSRVAEVEQVAATLQRGHWLWLGLALLVELAYLVNIGLGYRAIYRLLGMQAPLARLLPLAITSNFVNIVAPTAGMGGMAVFISDARRHSAPAARVAIAGVLFVLYDYFGFLVVLALGLVVLFRRNHLTAVEVTASIVLVALVVALAGLLVLGVYSGRTLDRVLLGLARVVNRGLRPLLRRDYLSEARAHEFAIEAAEGLTALRAGPRGYLLPAVLSLFGRALLIVNLALVFLAFQVPFTAGTLVAGFSIGYLFTIVSPTPAGIGVVEGMLTLGLTTLRVPLGAATVITLAYRGVTFWLPFVGGFVALRILEHQWHRKALEQVAP